jgi:hypothetical protein
MERVTEGVGLVDHNCIGEGQSRDGRMEEIKVVCIIFPSLFPENKKVRGSMYTRLEDSGMIR